MSVRVVAVEVVVWVVVAVLVVVGVLVVVVVGVLVVVAVELEVGVLLEVEVLDVVSFVAFRQSLAASSATVEAPCSRFRVSVALTDGGRLIRALLNVVIALAAASH